MLHSLPALLDELEHKLIEGHDPMPLLASVRWQEVIDWPTTLPEAKRLQVRLGNLRRLISALEAPLRATLMRLHQGGTYASQGGVALPSTLSMRVYQQI